MAKKYGYDTGDTQGGPPLGKPRTVREPYKKSHQGYDYVDPGRGVKDVGEAAGRAGKAVVKGLGKWFGGK